VDNVTIVSPGVRISGTMTGRGPVAVGGRVDGRIAVDGEVQVEARAHVDADIHADTVAIAGHVKGHVKARTSVTLAAGAQVEGILESQRAEIDPQARVRGRLIMPVTLPRGVKAPTSSSSPAGW